MKLTAFIMLPLAQLKKTNWKSIVDEEMFPVGVFPFGIKY
jgi:hypothetical protein